MRFGLRHLLTFASLACALLVGTGPLRANEICAAEFQPLIEKHQQVLQETQAAMPRGRPQNFDQARANAQRACRALGNTVSSFERLRTWVTNNQEFCGLPEQIGKDISTGLTNAQRNRTQACGAIAQMERARRQAEAGGGGGGDPFNPSASRRPQLDLRTPGAL